VEDLLPKLRLAQRSLGADPLPLINNIGHSISFGQSRG
jgi:hypothetical protein